MHAGLGAEASGVGYENGVLFTALLLPNEWLYVPLGYWPYVLSVAESAAMLTIVIVPHVVPKAFALLPKARRAGGQARFGQVAGVLGYSGLG